MSRTFDYGGRVVSASHPVKALKTVKKTFMIDSADRDTTKYYTNGDFVVYLPRVYENVVSLRLMAAEFPRLHHGTDSFSALSHSYADGSKYSSDKVINNGLVDGLVPTGDIENVWYLLLDIEGMNKTDECAIDGNKSGFPDNYFAKIPFLTDDYTNFNEYSDHQNQENIARYTPAIGKLDRLHIRMRLHSQADRSGFVYWTTDGNYAGCTTKDASQTPALNADSTVIANNQKGAGYSLSFEIEYLDNVFDDFSSLETHLTDRK